MRGAAQLDAEFDHAEVAKMIARARAGRGIHTLRGSVFAVHPAETSHY